MYIIGFSELQRKIAAINDRNKIVWLNVAVFVLLHLGAFVGLWLTFTRASGLTVIYTYVYAVLCLVGITAGAHRLWSHRSYKAKLPLRIILMLMQTGCLQSKILDWARYHRVHHKYTDTDADPHTVKRGFFFSHAGWWLLENHKDFLAKEKTLDLSDLKSDPVVMFQSKYYTVMAPILCFFFPAFFPWYFWSENWWTSFFVAGMLKHVLSIHYTGLVNSAAHMFGSKPYDKTITPTENPIVTLLTNGEGWHNYHHVFPADYKAAELGNYGLNLTTGFIDLMAKIGWAYDLKSVSPEMLKKRIERTGTDLWAKADDDVYESKK